MTYHRYFKSNVWLALGFVIVIALGFIFGCATAPVVNTEPPQAQYKTIQWECERQHYTIHIPSYVPDFTGFQRHLYSLGDPRTSRLDVICYHLPSQIPDHFSFIVDNLKGICPGILAFITSVNKELRFWIYYTDEPMEGTEDEYMAFKRDYLAREAV